MTKEEKLLESIFGPKPKPTKEEPIRCGFCRPDLIKDPDKLDRLIQMMYEPYDG